MIHNILFLLTLMLFSCTSQSQNLNKEILEASGKPHLVGKINKEGLSSQNYNSWFTTGYDEYQPQADIVKEISGELKDYDILLFMGTWCGDSRREVPRFYKVLENTNYPMNQLTSVAVSRAPGLYKQSPTHEEKGMNIHRVPTFIFYKNGIELNRIVEHPVRSIEEDILSILQGCYTSNYYLVTKINELIENKNFYDEAIQEIESFKSMASNIYELNTYSRILESTGKNDKALEILKLNTHLFSKQPATYLNLANFQLKSNRKKEALNNYEKAYALNPENIKVKNKIELLKSELSSTNN